VGAEFGNFAGGIFTHVNGDPDYANQCGNKNERDQPGRNVPDTQCPVKRGNVFHRHGRMQKNLGHPCNHDQSENENIVSLQSATDRFKLADLEAGQNEIFADQLFPFAFEQLPVLHYHWHEKMRLEHSHSRAKGVVEPIATGFDPKHPRNNEEIKKEDDMRNVPVRERNRDNGSTAGDGPVRRNIESLAPNHDPAQLAPIEMGHGIDIARIINASLEGNGRFLV
jgi:hypothetical protein